MIKLLDLAYMEGIRRCDVVIDIKTLPKYLKKNDKNEISIIGIKNFGK